MPDISKETQMPQCVQTSVTSSAVHHGDCLELMKDIPDGSIDMILCDLPYGTTACKWDVIIPFDELWSQYKRIIKTNGSILLFAKQPFTSNLITSNIKNFKYCFVWEKTTGSNFANAKKQPLMVTEDILVFCYGSIRYTPLTEKKDKKNIRNTISNNVYKYKEGDQYFGTKAVGKYNEFRTIPTDEKYTSNVLKISGVGNNNKNRMHPTQKPVDLVERLLYHYSNEGDLILDNCAGSGTTAIACINTNRSYILIEKEKKYFDIINERIAKHNKLRDSELDFDAVS